MTRMRRCFALDLADDPQLIAEYEARHRPGAVWPGVLAHLAAQGFRTMEIWRTGDRLVMVADVAADVPRPVPTPPEVERWEAEMDRYQRRLPGSDGAKWLEMTRIFAWDDPAG